MALPDIRLSVIGKCEITLGPTRVRPDSAVLFALLLYLAMRAGTRVPRAALLELLWPDGSEHAQRHALRQLLYRIRRAGVEIDVDGADLVLDPSVVATDLGGLLDPAWPNEVRLADVPAPAEVLPGYAPALTAGYGAWVDGLREEAAAQIRRAALRHIAAGRRECRWRDVDHAARRCLAADALNEDATHALAEATAMSGSQAEAVRILDTYLLELGAYNNSEARQTKLLRRRIAAQPHFRVPRAGEPPLVGRAEDLAWLNERLDAVGHGGVSVAMLAGAPGIGKTAVVRAFTAHAEVRGWRIVTSRLQASDADRSMAVFVELLPTLLRTEGSLGAAPESIAQLRRLVELRGDDEDSILAGKSQEAEAIQARIKAGALDLIGAVSHEGPLILVLEDLHWTDGASLRLLAWLLDHAAEMPVLWLLTSRLESRFGVVRATLPIDRVPMRMLEPLGPEDSVTMFMSLTLDPGSPVATKGAPLVHGLTGGNPLFIREVAGHWRDTGGADQLPGNLRALMRERVARLSGVSLRVLHACAVLGRFATVPRVSAVLGMTTVELLGAIEELDGLGLVGLSGEPGSLALHDLWQEELASGIKPGSLALLHLRAGEALEVEVQEGRLPSASCDAARHLRFGGARSRALGMFQIAAEYQLANGLTEDAISSLDEALAIAELDGDRLKIAERRLAALQLIGRWSDIATSIDAAITLSRSVHGVESEHTPLELMGVEAAMLSALDLRHTMDRAARCISSPESDPAHCAVAAQLGARAASNLMDAERLLAFAEAARSLDDPDHDVKSNVLATETVYHTDIGSLATAVSVAEGLVAAERAGGAVRGLTRALRYLTVPLRTASSFADAERCGREAFGMATAHHMAEEAASVADVLANTMFEAGDLDAACYWLDHGQPWVRRIGHGYVKTSTDTLRAMIALERGDVSAARFALPEEPRITHASQVIRPQLYQIAVAVRANLATGEIEKARALAVLLRSELQRAHRFRRLGYLIATLVAVTAVIDSEAAATGVARDHCAQSARDGVQPWRELASYVA